MSKQAQWSRNNGEGEHIHASGGIDRSYNTIITW